MRKNKLCIKPHILLLNYYMNLDGWKQFKYHKSKENNPSIEKEQNIIQNYLYFEVVNSLMQAILNIKLYCSFVGINLMQYLSCLCATHK